MQQAVFHHYYDVHVTANFAAAATIFSAFMPAQFAKKLTQCNICACRKTNTSGCPASPSSKRITCSGCVISVMTRRK
jgi:hypothetical protein